MVSRNNIFDIKSDEQTAPYSRPPAPISLSLEGKQKSPERKSPLFSRRFSSSTCIRPTSFKAEESSEKLQQLHRKRVVHARTLSQPTIIITNCASQSDSSDTCSPIRRQHPNKTLHHRMKFRPKLQRVDSISREELREMEIHQSKHILGSGRYFQVSAALCRLSGSNKGGDWRLCAVKTPFVQSDTDEPWKTEHEILKYLATIKSSAYQSSAISDPFALHQHFLPVLGINVSSNALVFPLCLTTSWNYVRTQTDNVTLSCCKKWTSQALEAVAFLHDAGVIHCDIKPANVMIQSDLSLVLIDFASSCFIEELPISSKGRGTVAYSAPEFHQDEAWTEKADTFSLGATLYTLFFTAREPFAGIRHSAELILNVSRGAFWQFEERARVGHVNGGGIYRSGSLRRHHARSNGSTSGSIADAEDANTLDSTDKAVSSETLVANLQEFIASSGIPGLDLTALPVLPKSPKPSSASASVHTQAMSNDSTTNALPLSPHVALNHLSYSDQTPPLILLGGEPCPEPLRNMLKSMVAILPCNRPTASELLEQFHHM